MLKRRTNLTGGDTPASACAPEPSAREPIGSNLALGLRATPRGFHYAILSGSRSTAAIEDHGGRDVPATYTLSQGIALLSADITDLFKRYSIASVAIREADHSKFALDASARNRIRIEGALMAACARAGLDPQIVVWKSMAASIGFEKSDKKQDVMRQSSLRGIDWSGLKPEPREAVVAALSVLR